MRMQHDPSRWRRRGTTQRVAVQRNFPKAVIGYRLFGGNPNRSFAARAREVRDADFSAVRLSGLSVRFIRIVTCDTLGVEQLRSLFFTDQAA